MSKWLRKGDKVVVIAGNEKGRVGIVSARSEDRIIIEGLNLRKKHVKRQQKVQKGIVDIAAPIHISNVMASDSEGKPIKLKVKVTSVGKELVYRSAKGEVTYRSIKREKS